jgi:3,4-dihydroxy 2-butanone 4-phosphate synthase / GTP cyclohydrolase II
MALATIEEALTQLQSGRMIVLVDDEDRENEGDLVIAAEAVTPESINFMATYGRGWICLSLDDGICRALDLGQMVADEENEAPFSTAFTVTVEARHGVTTGISAADRATTILAAAREGARAEDLVRPGHVQPIRACRGGVLVRAGQTEGSVDLARLAGLRPAAVICEIMNPDGSMARMPDLEAFAREHDLPICSVAQVIEYRRRREQLVECIQSVKLPTDAGLFDLHCYVSRLDPREHHIALTLGRPAPGRGETIEDPVLLRVHSECLTGDVFHSNRCDCGEQLHAAMTRIQEEGEGAVVYMRQEGRGIGLPNKIRAYGLQDSGLDTVEANERLGFAADLRDYGLGAQIIADLGIRRLRLLTNNPRKVAGLEGHGLELVERLPLVMEPKATNRNYLHTKRTKLGHLLDSETVPGGTS